MHTHAYVRAHQAGANITLRSKDGLSALHWAAKGGEPSAIRVLVNAGANLEARDIKGYTPIYTAVANHQLDAIYVRTAIMLLCCLLRVFGWACCSSSTATTTHVFNLHGRVSVCLRAWIVNVEANGWLVLYVHCIFVAPIL